jgi:hypothetical protein
MKKIMNEEKKENETNEIKDCFSEFDERLLKHLSFWGKIDKLSNLIDTIYEIIEQLFNTCFIMMVIVPFAFLFQVILNLPAESVLIYIAMIPVPALFVVLILIPIALSLEKKQSNMIKKNAKKDPWRVVGWED